MQEKLPAAIEGGEPLPEGLLWLLLTGDVSSSATLIMQYIPACRVPKLSKLVHDTCFSTRKIAADPPNEPRRGC